jgi:glutaredoxin
MKLAYTRISALPYEEAAKRIGEAVKGAGWELVATKEIPSGTVAFISNGELMEGVLNHHADLVGVMPWTVFVKNEDGKAAVSAVDGSLLASLMAHHHHDEPALIGEGVIKIVNAIADVGELKVKEVKVFSTATCPYCAMEKDWLKQNNVEHTVVMVDADEEAAKYMVEHTGQMGVPATEVVYEEGESEFVVGFDKERLASLLKVS